MIRKLQMFAAFLVFSASAKSQLNNNGSITIQNNAYVMVMGNINNNDSGTITNDGKIEVQGNFINTGSYTSTTNEDSLLMTGNGIDTLTAGSSVINNLTINKISNSDSVRLGSTATINTKLDFFSGGLSTNPILNPSFTVTSPVTATYNFADSVEIAGSVKRTGWVNGTAYIFNQPNMQVTTNGGTSPIDFTVIMIPQSAGGDPTQNEREVKRKFLFAQTGGSGFTADIRYPYATSELNTNVASNIIPWKLLTIPIAEWNARLTTVTRDTVNHYVIATGIPIADLSMEWKLADPKYNFNVTAFLRGAWNVSAMNTYLNSGGILPLKQPYNTNPYNYNGGDSVSSIPNANIVDWVLVELRKPTSGLPADANSTTIIGRKAGFLLNDGIVVDLDGATPLSFNIIKQGSSFLVIRHRNHLGVISNSIPSNSAGTFANDYSLLANSYKDPSASSDPVALLSGGKYGLWAGDANEDGVVNATDVNLIKIATANSASGYLPTDVNLSNSINVNDVNLTKITTSSSGTGSGTFKTGPFYKDRIQSNIPDPIIK
jgi:hypothetical protein